MVSSCSNDRPACPGGRSPQGRGGPARSRKPAAARPAAGLASSDFPQQILQDRMVEHAGRKQAFQRAVLVIKLAQAPRVGHLQTGYSAFNLQNVAAFKPCLRQTSTVGCPASCSLISPRICASARRLALMRLCLPMADSTSDREIFPGGTSKAYGQRLAGLREHVAISRTDQFKSRTDSGRLHQACYHTVVNASARGFRPYNRKIRARSCGPANQPRHTS